MNLTDIIFLICSSVFIGLLASILGIGGGILTVPLLTLVFGLSSQIAIGTSLLAAFSIAISSTISYQKKNLISYKTGLLMALGSIPGGFVGAYTTSLVSSNLLLLIFGISLIIISLRFFKLTHRSSTKKYSFKQNNIGNSSAESIRMGKNLLLGISMSFLAGGLSGFLGLGGGIIIVPVLRFIIGFPIHISVATSLFIMVITTISGIIVHAGLNHIMVQYAIIIVIGVIVGALCGSYLSVKLPGRYIEKLFGVSLFLIGSRMILEFLN